MFENGSLWKPPPLKNLRSKLLPPLDEDIIRRGQLSNRWMCTVGNQFSLPSFLVSGLQNQGCLFKGPGVHHFKGAEGHHAMYYCRQRDELEDQLRHISMEREKIKKSMVWCLDHADSAEEVFLFLLCWFHWWDLLLCVDCGMHIWGSVHCWNTFAHKNRSFVSSQRYTS